MRTMRTIRAILATLLFAIISSYAVSASFSTDQSDLYWADPPGSENGWGFQLVQRNSTIFITLFVYGQTSAPTWYVSTTTPTGTPFQWSGDLYTTTARGSGPCLTTPGYSHFARWAR